MSTTDFIEFFPESERRPVEVVRAQTAVCWLSARFGDQREWSDFLSDCRRRKNVEFYGLQLLPCGLESKARHIYRMQDLEDFAHQAELAGAGPASITIMHCDEFTRSLVRDPSTAKPVKEKRKLTEVIH